jgi:hypothetical protein
MRKVGVALVVVVLVLSFQVSVGEAASSGDHLGSSGASTAAGVHTSATAAVLQTVTAQGVALNSDADCTNADLDITLTSVDAIREFGQTSLLDGTIVGSFEQGTGLANFSGTYIGYGMPVSPDQSAGTVIGSYAYVGTTPPSAATTGEFFVAYVCDTGEVLYSCYGPYGTCPQTAQQWQAQAEPIPALSSLGIALFAGLLGVLGLGLLIWRRTV